MSYSLRLFVIKVVTFSFGVGWIFQRLDKNKNDSDHYQYSEECGRATDDRYSILGGKRLTGD